MNRIFLFLSIISFVFISCNNNKTKDKEPTGTSKDSSKVTPADDKVAEDVSKKLEEKSGELEKLQPVNLDQLKAMLPTTLLNAKQTDPDTNNGSGTGVATAEYPLNDSATITLSIYDCGGSGGAGFYKLHFANQLNNDKDDEDEYAKAIDFKGVKAFEYCDKASGSCTFSYLSGGRYLILLEGEDTGIAKLKEAANTLDIK
jgi:hypothetical protein